MTGGLIGIIEGSMGIISGGVIPGKHILHFMRKYDYQRQSIFSL